MFNEDLLSELYEEIEEKELQELGIDIEDTEAKLISVEQANFYLRQLEKLRAEKDEVNSLCDNEIEKYAEKVNTFRESRLNTITNGENFIIEKLRAFAETELSESGKKSLKLPFGTLAFKKSPAKYNYDDKVVLDFLKNNHIDSCVRVKEELNKTELKKSATVKDGVLYIEGKEIPGTSVVEGEINFNVKI